MTVDGDLLEVCRNQDRQPDELMKPTSVNEDTRQPTSFRSYINLFATTPCRGLSLSRWMVKPHQFRVGDLVKVLQVPPHLHDAAGIGTPELFQRVLGKTLRIDGFGRYGRLELNVLDDGSQAPDYCHHTIWIEPEFVKAADDATATM